MSTVSTGIGVAAGTLAGIGSMAFVASNALGTTSVRGTSRHWVPNAEGARIPGAPVGVSRDPKFVALADPVINDSTLVHADNLAVRNHGAEVLVHEFHDVPNDAATVHRQYEFAAAGFGATAAVAGGSYLLGKTLLAGSAAGAGLRSGGMTLGGLALALGAVVAIAAGTQYDAGSTSR